MSIIYVVIFIAIWLIFFVILPSMKRKRCTLPVKTMLANKKKVFSRGEMKTMGDMTYFYNGKVYVIKLLFRSSSAESMKLLINPEKPEEWVKADTKQYYTFMFCSFVFLILLIAAIYVY